MEEKKTEEILWKPIGGLWQPQQEKDSIEGRLRSTYEDDSDYGKVQVYVLETESDLRQIFGSTVLDEKMKFIRPGELVKIVYLGKKQGEKKEYNNYEVSKGSFKHPYSFD